MSYKFSGHQTFVFRHGWLEKGVNLVRHNPRGFISDDAVVKLGVGKNMVDSIRYWCTQSGLIEDAEENGCMCLTDFARYIFGNGKTQGVDPYLEDDATLWLVHYNLAARAPESALSITLNSLNKAEFTKAELLSFIKRHIEGKTSVSEKTIERDIDCFVRVYAGTKNKKAEESFDCPLLALSLIQDTVDTDLYRMNIGFKHNLPCELIGYALLKMMGENSTTTNLYNAVYAVHSPGQVFKLDENTMVDALLKLEQVTNGKLSYSDTAGLNTITYSGSCDSKSAYAQKLLDQYYGI